MTQVNMLEAKSNLSKLVDMIERGQAKEIVIARHGRPAARLIPVRKTRVSQRLGVAKGKFQVPDDIDRHNTDVARLLLGEADK